MEDPYNSDVIEIIDDDSQQEDEIVDETLQIKVFEPKRPPVVKIDEIGDDLIFIDEKKFELPKLKENKKTKPINTNHFKLPKMKILMPITIQVPKMRLNFDEIGDINKPDLPDTRKDENFKFESQKTLVKKDTCNPCESKQIPF